MINKPTANENQNTKLLDLFNFFKYARVRQVVAGDAAATERPRHLVGGERARVQADLLQDRLFSLRRLDQRPLVFGDVAEELLERARVDEAAKQTTTATSCQAIHLNALYDQLASDIFSKRLILRKR